MGLVTEISDNNTYVNVAYLRTKFKTLPFVYRNVCDYILNSVPDNAKVIIDESANKSQPNRA